MSIKSLAQKGAVTGTLALSWYNYSFGAACDPTATGNGAKSGADCAGAGTVLNNNLGATVKAVVNTLIFIVGLIAVVIIIVAGLRYVLSQGDEKAVGGAKNAMLYAIIGLVIALLAYAIVNFVLGRLGVTT